jgi:hypothetical protein
MLLGTPCSRMTSLKKRSTIFVVSSVLWQTMKCVILENLFTTTNMESLPFLDLGKPKIKSIEISTQCFLGTSKSVYNKALL